ncbi:hypothetical protein [Roseimicrobium sp. ORNL1]|uniref:hypothetical protein n=1 Tax=Roseimicrobium sp. ORNL1 TaxID=2711231 RepID=UPI0013E1FD98|nr:hypothetical protein [Roseimicrobium sp. ORNL1]QIF04642.1 hypothetical protein G5S37_24970 [Roseimicrobium sp. ORNL1]
MRNTYFIGPWKGMGAAMEDCAEETGHSVAHLLRIGADRVLQEYHTTGRVSASKTVREPKAGRPTGSRNDRRGNAPPSTLDKLHRASLEAREEVNRLRTTWVQFVMQNGEQGKLAAFAGGRGYGTWLRLKRAIEREREAVEKLAEARVALTPSGRR